MGKILTASEQLILKKVARDAIDDFKVYSPTFRLSPLAEWAFSG